MNNILVFQGVFNPQITWEAFINCIDNKLLKYIDSETLLQLKDNKTCSLYDLVQITHAVNVSKFLRWKNNNYLENTTFFSGFSIGIYAALYASKQITLEDSFTLIKARAKLLIKAVNKKWNIYSISGVKLDTLKRLENENKLFLSTISSRKHASIAICIDNEHTLLPELESIGYIKLNKLFINAAWHTPVMKHEEKALKKLFSKYTIQVHDKILFSQNTNNEKLLSGILLNDCFQSVNWQDTISRINIKRLFPIFFDETNTLEKTWYTNIKSKEYKVVRCAQFLE